MHFLRLLKIPSLLSLTLLAGCASVSVGNIHPKGTPPKSLPAKIYVEEFEAPAESFRVDRSDRDLKEFIANERHKLAAALVVQLSKYIAPAEVLPEGKKAPKGNAWMIHGIFDRVNQGSRAMRIGIGFGAGGTKMETHVQVCSLAKGQPAPFLSMLTTGGSGVAPGAWAAFTPAGVFFIPGAVANAGGASLGGLSVDLNRTAREITATLSEYCFQNGLIPERRTRRPKKLGSAPPLQRPDFIAPKTAP